MTAGAQRPWLAGFLKVRDEIVREGNLYRVLGQLGELCDGGVLCDDGSADGTTQALERFVEQRPGWRLLTVPVDEQDFRRELAVKQRMLDILRELNPEWVLWLDGDEVFDARGSSELRTWLAGVERGPEHGWSFHYQQLWRSTGWSRSDDGFEESWSTKLWRYRPDLSFEIRDGTHGPQCPVQIELTSRGPFEILHYGNVGKNLVWKALQYSGGLEDTDRHLIFDGATYRPVSPSLFPAVCEQHPSSATPTPFTADEVSRIRGMAGLCNLPGWFTVVVPSFNRAHTLARALDSLLAQTHEQWVAIVLDDGSADDTSALMRVYQDRDPRIFFARYPVNRGGVAMNEIGMALACGWTEYWTRLGSDDWFEPHKLERDAVALAEHDAVHGPFKVRSIEGGPQSVSGGPVSTADLRTILLGQHRFGASWANCAARTSVLRRVRDAYGNFCDPRLRNMEDFLFNVRAARHSRGWVWRGVVAGTLVVDPTSEQAAAAREIAPDATWTMSNSGASANRGQLDADEALTLEILAQERDAPPAGRTPLRVSLCMIVKDEALHLGECLDAVEGLFDEIVVVDTGSADGTRAVAEAHGARVIDFPWCDDFAAARNESIRNATGDWIFWMDADDRLSAAGVKALRELLGRLPHDHVGYFFTVVNPGPDGDVMSQLAHVRLFRNRPDVRWRGRVHEQIALPLLQSGARLVTTPIVITHLGYRGVDMAPKLERNLRLLDRDLAEAPLDPNLLLFRARTLLGLGRAAEALIALGPLSRLIDPGITALAAYAYAAEGMYSEALSTVQRGLEDAPYDTKLLFCEGALRAAEGDYAGAAHSLGTLLLIGEHHDGLDAADRTIASFRARYVLAELHRLEGRPQDAEREARALLAGRPAFGPGWVTLGGALLDQGRGEAIPGMLAAMSGSPYARTAEVVLRSEASLSAQCPDEALATIDGELRTSPESYDLLRCKAWAMFHMRPAAADLGQLVRAQLQREPFCCPRTHAIRRRLSAASGPLGLAVPLTLAERTSAALEPLILPDA